ncbi:hypothetical protein Y032_0214g2331 [Ancylostoma ceylanicum]|uniref:FHA domain-containing protein n=1 Tax=Ancylostoma ceylanicum TaxID=53326 RepID=A0A016SKD1_9BILA|nr:hypothetical protein Y032_0214g2331 [Ancylostoma ceylanicum]
MLRRYSSRNLETIPIQSKVLTIGTDKCDLKINAKGVHPIHASIEQNPASGTFWLRDHSLAGHTSVNGHTVNGQVELHNGDLVRIGRAQPYVFEKRPLLPMMNGNAPNEELVGNGNVGETALPILGKRISPLPPQSRSAARRPVTAVAKSRRSASSAPKTTGKTKVVREEVRVTSPPSSIDTASESSTRSGLKQTIHTRGSVGNHLLQRVIRLQDEVARKNSEIDELRRRQCTSCHDVPPSPRRHSYFHFARSPLPPVGNMYSSKNFELEAYRAFIGTVAAKVRSFNNYILRNRNASYSDVFSAFFHVINEPISDQMLEIERECDIELERKGFSAIQRTQLADFFRNDRRESISNSRPKCFYFIVENETIRIIKLSFPNHIR